jgi:SAM-dependent methyltransferase
MAIPLTTFLSADGSYDGFDIVPHGIAWCSRRITRRFPQFRFRLVPVRNRDYNPRGEATAATFRFPYPDDTFDFVFLTSVFTHMVASEVENYMREIARVLKPGGTSFITWFLLNDESRSLLAGGHSSLHFQHAVESGLTVDAMVPEQAVALTEEDVLAWYRSNGMALDAPPYYGSWCGRRVHVDFQDIIVARKGFPR